MILNIKVIPKAKTNRIQELGQNCLKVHLSALPVNGKANKALCKLLSQHYKVKKNQVIIMRGEYSQNKVIQIKEEGDE